MMTKKEKPMLSVAAIIQAQGRWDRALAGKNTSEQRNIKNYCNKIEMVKYCSFPHHLFHLSRIKLFLGIRFTMRQIIFRYTEFSQRPTLD
jgi:hypothetical protein